LGTHSGRHNCRTGAHRNLDHNEHQSRPLIPRSLDGIDGLFLLAVAFHRRTLLPAAGMSAMPPKADIRLTSLIVCFGPKAAVSRRSSFLFDKQ